MKMSSSSGVNKDGLLSILGTAATQKSGMNALVPTTPRPLAVAPVTRRPQSQPRRRATVTKKKAGASKKKAPSAAINNKKKAAIPQKGQKTAAKPVLKPRTWKKPEDKPKRPLSAYNLFFQNERRKILLSSPGSANISPEVVLGAMSEQKRRRHRKSHGMIGFAALARKIADKWKKLDDASRSPFEAEAAEEKKRYKIKVEAWYKAKQEEAACNTKSSSNQFSDDGDTGTLQKKPASAPAEDKTSMVLPAPQTSTAQSSVVKSSIAVTVAKDKKTIKGSSFQTDKRVAADSHTKIMQEKKNLAQHGNAFHLPTAEALLSSHPFSSDVPLSCESSDMLHVEECYSSGNTMKSMIDLTDGGWIGSFHPVDADHDSILTENDLEDLEDLKEEQHGLYFRSWQQQKQHHLPDLAISSLCNAPFISPAFPMYPSSGLQHPPKQPSKKFHTKDTMMQGILSSLDDLGARIDDDFVDLLSTFDA